MCSAADVYDIVCEKLHLREKKAFALYEASSRYSCRADDGHDQVRCLFTTSI